MTDSAIISSDAGYFNIALFGSMESAGALAH